MKAKGLFICNENISLQICKRDCIWGGLNQGSILRLRFFFGRLCIFPLCYVNYCCLGCRFSLICYEVCVNLNPANTSILTKRSGFISRRISFMFSLFSKTAPQHSFLIFWIKDITYFIKRKTHHLFGGITKDIRYCLIYKCKLIVLKNG